ncbi:MAG: type II toxin-antitoxin system VapC family toxin [Polyangia bacterium]
MRVLLDTHALLWWLDGDRRLSQRARRLIGNDETTVLVSAASAWEICTKFRLGRLPGAAAVAADVTGCLDGQGFLPLPITVDHAQRAGSLPGPHRDPFDRVLIAQAQAEDLPLVTVDPVFRLYGMKLIW